MSNALEIIKNELTKKETINKMTMALGFTSGDEDGKAQAFRYAASVLAEVEKTAGDSKKDLTVCDPRSIAQSCIDAARFQIMIDGRQHAHLVKYGNAATLQIGYRGYIAKIKEHYPDAEFSVELVYEGDGLKIWDDSGVGQYTLTKANPFAEGEANLKGALVAIAYTDNNRMIRKIITMTKADILKARKAAKQDFIWGSWFGEKAKAAAIKRACKILFASITGLQEMIRYDNEKNFALPTPAEQVQAGNIVDNLNSSLIPDKDEIIDANFVTVDEPKEIPPHVTLAKKITDKIETFTDAALLQTYMAEDVADDLDTIQRASEATYAHVVKKYDEKIEIINRL